MNSDKGKELLATSPDQTELHFKDGDSKVFTDKNGKPIVAKNYLKRLEKQREEQNRLEENLHWESTEKDRRDCKDRTDIF